MSNFWLLFPIVEKMTGFAAYGIMALFSDVISSFLFSKASFIVEVFEAIVHNGMVALPLELYTFVYTVVKHSFS